MSSLHVSHQNNFDLSEALAAVEQRMRAYCDGEAGANNAITSAAAFHLEAGGKRTRARLTLDASQRLGLPQSDAVALAAATELLHNASLVHDDLQDRDEWRRGKPALWRAYGANVAICVGDLMISAAYAALAEVSRPDVLPRLLRTLHDAVAVCIRGQHRDLKAQQIPVRHFADYEAIAIGKSAPLLALPLVLPLIAAGDEGAAQQAATTAEHFAIGYQIADDLEDVALDRGEGGRPAGLNAVLVLQTSAAFAQAAAEAAERGLSHLDQATDLAEQLPRQSGLSFVVLAQRLKEQIGLRAHDVAHGRGAARKEGAFA